jgi:hypothetical protein
MKILQIEFKFRYIVLQQNNKRICGSDTLDDIQATPCPKVSPSAAVNAYGASQYGAQPSYVWTSHW